MIFTAKKRAMPRHIVMRADGQHKAGLRGILRPDRGQQRKPSGKAQAHQSHLRSVRALSATTESPITSMVRAVTR